MVAMKSKDLFSLIVCWSLPCCLWLTLLAPRSEAQAPFARNQSSTNYNVNLPETSVPLYAGQPKRQDGSYGDVRNDARPQTPNLPMRSNVSLQPVPQQQTTQWTPHSEEEYLLALRMEEDRLKTFCGPEHPKLIEVRQKLARLEQHLRHKTVWTQTTLRHAEDVQNSSPKQPIIQQQPWQMPSLEKTSGPESLFDFAWKNMPSRDLPPEITETGEGVYISYRRQPRSITETSAIQRTTYESAIPKQLNEQAIIAAHELPTNSDSDAKNAPTEPIKETPQQATKATPTATDNQQKLPNITIDTATTSWPLTLLMTLGAVIVALLLGLAVHVFALSWTMRHLKEQITSKIQIEIVGNGLVQQVPATPNQTHSKPTLPRHYEEPTGEQFDLGPSYEEERIAKAQSEKQQEQALLRQIFAKNQELMQSIRNASDSNRETKTEPGSDE